MEKEQEQDKGSETVIIPQPTEENPLVVENYPYGFRLRTKIRYWVETTKAGQRFCSQTLNPKTQAWNKPKKSTYSEIVKVFKDEQGHIHQDGFGLMYSDKAEFEAFKERFKSAWTEADSAKEAHYNAVFKAREHISVEVKERQFRNKKTGEIKTCLDVFELGDYEEVKDENEAEKQAQVKKDITKIYAYYLAKEFEKAKA